MRPARPRLVLFSAALVVLAAVLAVLLPPGIASAAGRPAAETRVWAFSLAAQDHVRADSLVPAGQRLGEAAWCPFCVSGACVAPEEAAATSRTYIDLTRGGSIRNVGTDATHAEFADTLASSGWTSSISRDGAVQIFENDGAKYVLRQNAGSYGGWTADFTPAGSTDITLKIRLGYSP